MASFRAATNWAAPQILAQASWESYNWQSQGDDSMRKRRTPEQIARLLGEIQADLRVGLTVELALRKAGVGPTTYYR